MIHKAKFVFLLISFLFLALFTLNACISKPKQMESTIDKKPIVIAYVGGFRGIVDAKAIDVDKLTHINYAFVNVKDSMAYLENLATDSVNFKNLVDRKKDNPDLKILISIGGWSWSHNFSDAVLTPSSRKKFAKSAVDIVRKYNLDGVDIDWEYPGLRGEDNVFRPEDKQNYTLMFKAIREELDKLAETTGKDYEVTTAVAGFDAYLENTEMDEAQKYLDYINIMSYDFYVSGDTAGHHTNLYRSEGYNKGLSTHQAVRKYIEAGVPEEKIVVGIAFYGRSWIMKTDDNLGINRPTEKTVRGGGYSYLKDSLINQKGFKRYWDDTAKAPYLFNSETRQLVSYDDEESVKHKCEYVKENNLAGVMFWEYNSDPKEYLLNSINENLY